MPIAGNSGPGSAATGEIVERRKQQRHQHAERKSQRDEVDGVAVAVAVYHGGLFCPLYIRSHFNSPARCGRSFHLLRRRAGGTARLISEGGSRAAAGASLPTERSPWTCDGRLMRGPRHNVRLRPAVAREWPNIAARKRSGASGRWLGFAPSLPAGDRADPYSRVMQSIDPTGSACARPAHFMRTARSIEPDPRRQYFATPHPPPKARGGPKARTPTCPDGFPL